MLRQPGHLFVAALDQVGDVRCVLGLFEGVATGAADGYARMADKPASTLLHLGPGLANGLANVHNARRANTPMVNIVGDHATYHKHYDAPLTSDVEGVARPSPPTPPGTRRTGRSRCLPSRVARRSHPRQSPPLLGSCAPANPRSCLWADMPCANRA
jgi:hypothetical protein